MSKPSILVLHGMTMSGSSMLQLLGPLRPALESAGFDLIAPNAGELSPEEVERLLGWLKGTYAKQGQEAEAFFTKGVFWDDEGYYDWFGAETDPDTKEKTYTHLEASLASIRACTQGKEIVGILGFSQGCAMAGLAAGLARKGHLPFGDTLRFGVFLSGFKPTFDHPATPAPWPVPDVVGWFAVGSEDAVFPDPSSIQGLAAEFSDAQVHIIEGLQHTVPTDPLWTQRIVDFATAHHPERT